MKTSPLNLFLIFSGLIILSIGLFRVNPIKLDSKFLWDKGPLALAFFIILVMSAQVGQHKYLLAGLDASMATAAGFVPMLVLLVPIIGFSAPLAHHFQDDIARLIAGKFGYPIVFITSTLSPSGNAFASVVTKLWAREDLRPVLLYFTTVIPLTSISIYYFRILGFGQEVAIAMYKANVLSAILLCPFYYYFGPFLCRFICK